MMRLTMACTALAASLLPAAVPGVHTPHTPALQRGQAPPECRIRFETSQGPITAVMHRAWSPHGADRFYELVQSGFYDGARIFRVREGVFAQFGIPADPEVAKRWRTQTIPDDPRRESYVRGTLAYAFKDPDGRTTQVFFNLRDNSAAFDAEPFVPFAAVEDGMAAADRFFAGYGESAGGGIRAGRQGPLFELGNAYLLREFPKLDYIVRARVVR